MHLRATTLQPRLVPLLRGSECVLVRLFAPFLGSAGRERDDLQGIAPGAPGAREQRTLRAGLLVEMVENRGGIDEHRTVIQNERRHTPERTEFADAFEVLADRPVGVLEGKLEQLQTDRHRPHEGRVEHSDQDHFRLSPFVTRRNGAPKLAPERRFAQ